MASHPYLNIMKINICNIFKCIKPFFLGFYTARQIPVLPYRTKRGNSFLSLLPCCGGRGKDEDGGGGERKRFDIVMLKLEMIFPLSLVEQPPNATPEAMLDWPFQNPQGDLCRAPDPPPESPTSVDLGVRPGHVYFLKVQIILQCIQVEIHFLMELWSGPPYPG